MNLPGLDVLRRRATVKWTAYPDDVLPLWVAESDFATCPHIVDALSGAVEQERFGYPAPDGRMEKALAEFSAARHGFAVNPDFVRPTADVVGGLLLAIRHFTRPDSPVVVAVPAYPPFLRLGPMAGRMTMTTTYIPGADGRLEPDVDHIDSLFKKGAGCLILCNPHNPLGLTHSPQLLRELAESAARHGARIISDEIHCPLVYDRPHVAMASVSDTAAAVTITLTAGSKAWNVAGLKCAQIIFTNPGDVEVFDGLEPYFREGFSTLGLVAAEACYTAPLSFLDRQLEYLKGNRDWLARTLPEAIAGATVTTPEASYLSWIDFSDTPVADSPAAFFLRQARVALNEGTCFGDGGEHHARINFACRRDTLAEAVDRMADAVKKHSRLPG
ncbi:MalY/PatB family protein [Corynebacterium mendelii]|uniref:cysteine-S-conjugate beta-lyase n=1 Tax=Corynebacterium mendelii TaxID=2765362 RepID=A0A939E0I6_9CORY|nr:aminotransferase class I/II-fold pyridoxal phosphate-dependent enzyme [Corynebacterium mendelii]MBN9644216.1 aminotransferase class I/II-fold pyridoxal phosphate-dependent enzyme [Corynebacterium mendelii]